MQHDDDWLDKHFERCSDNCHEDSLDDAKKYHEHMKAIEKTPCWVSVEDRMPSVPGEYVCQSICEDGKPDGLSVFWFEADEKGVSFSHGSKPVSWLDNLSTISDGK